MWPRLTKKRREWVARSQGFSVLDFFCIQPLLSIEVVKEALLVRESAEKEEAGVVIA
eukprot:CAMPEP_0113277170 /NCGR_PEP_ID=MMETSP0008_2-20120614/25896_1 /TAXON_ID=97485 /ORGANISM="Prymnesium parvum" /LENGTH=56 /DNA_ID=CAMNT_0000127045 /DNA_START=60 /DNA_END=226 /DNA_ORIENTATION=+ /assembly_acc=CAM_ASM_000153